MNILKRTGKRMLALLLCLTLALSVPVTLSPTAQAAEPSWLTPYLEKMTSWGVVKGDGNGNYNSNRSITRAEFVAMLNRAYGYTDVGPIPFTDVRARDWFYDDIRIAYTAGIFHGASATLAKPNDPITREQAITLIARNMRMDETPGEIIDFTDGRSFSDYSRGYVKSAIAAGIIDGYSDGTVKPQKNVTRGEAMKMMCVGIGSLINTPGTQAPGGIFGNLTINCTNVTLKDTIITGDLYISGGVSLGDVVLENVQVRGRIVVAGGGSSELGQNSVLLRGVDTNKLIVDAPTGQYISVRTEGRTHIAEGAFRSDAFFEDGCRDGYGILNVSLEGASGDSFTLAGNLEKVVNRTPNSTLIVGDAQVASVTMDERATGSKLLMEVNASADEVNIDVRGATIEGTGDIGHLTINEPGCTTTMLPDTLAIRPGLNADVSGDTIDSSGAQKYSEDPRILNGYPKVANVAPTTADGINSTNKPGTIYWGLTTAAVGAIPDTEEGRQSLISPSYGSGFLLSGNYPADTWDIDLSIPERLTGLTSSGTYFISAVLVDSRKKVSPVYSERFETPDNIIPAFSSRDYPYMSRIECDDSEVTVMANKNCDIYYALLPKGSTQPATMDFLSFAGFEDAYGYGRIHLTKNKTWTQQVNRIIYPESMDRDDKVTTLAEQGTYDLYLWLADADGIKSSAITKLTFTTRDKTPPTFTTEMQQGPVGKTNVGVNCVINEPGTVHWAIVKTGTEYPKLPKDWEQKYETLENFMLSEEAKFQVANHQNALKTGSINTNGNADASANITGLEPETAYDLYYIAVDRAGNYSDIVKKITVYTEDSTPPKAELSFSRHAPDDPTSPYSDSDISIVFSENILDRVTKAEPLELYQTSLDTSLATDAEKRAAKQRLVEILEKNIKLFQVIGSTTKEVKIEWKYATLTLERDGKLTINLPAANKTVELGSGSQYYFSFQDITDASMQKNEMTQPGTPKFTTVSARAGLDEITAVSIPANATGNPNSTEKNIDIGFSITPEATDSAAPGTYWDMLLWLDTTSTFELYRRTKDKDGEYSNWKFISEKRQLVSTGSVGGSSLVVLEKKSNNALPYLLTGEGTSTEYLEEGKIYEFALYFKEMNGITNREAFNGEITCEVTVITGNRNNVSSMFTQLNKDALKTAINSGNIEEISSPKGYSITKPFSDQTAPEISDNRPTFTPGDSGVSITLALKGNRIGQIHYLIVPANVLEPLDENGQAITIPTYNSTTVDRDEHIFRNPGSTASTDNIVSRPTVSQVVQPITLGDINGSYVDGTLKNVGSASMSLDIRGLAPKTTYYAYFVTEGSSNLYSDEIYIYKFTTTDVTRPVLTLRQEGSIIKILTSLPSTTEINYIIVPHSDQMGSDLYKYLKKPAGDKTTSDVTTDVANQSAVKDKRIFELMDLPATVSSQGSKFDELAGRTVKQTLSTYVKTQSANSQAILGFGSGTATSAKELPVDLTNSKFDLKHETDYCLVAVGRSNLSDPDEPESYAFRATFPFKLQDTEAPKVTSAITYTEKMSAAGKFTGQVTLLFDKSLYCTTGSTNTLRTISVGTDGLTDSDTTGYISANSSKVISTSNAGINIYTNSQDPASVTSLLINFTSVGNNASCTFTSTLCNATRATRTPALTVTIKITTDRNGNYVASTEVTDEWKAKGFTSK